MADHKAQEVTRWVIAAALVLAAHTSLAARFLQSDEAETTAEVAGAFVVELAPMPIARADVPENVAPGPDQVEAAPQQEVVQEKKTEAEDTQPSPEPVPEPPPVVPEAPNPEVAMPPPSERAAEQPKQEAQPQAAAPTTSATQAISDQVADAAAAPVQAAPAKTNSETVPSWKARIETALERSKRYPASAQARQEQGVVHVSFVIDRAGKLVTSRVEKGSDHAALDVEALALLERAQPFPPPPPEIKSERIRLSVPIRFNLR